MRLLLAAGIDPAGMIAFFETLRRKDGQGPALLSYLSTHPDPQERIKKLKSLAQGPRKKSARLLPDYDWRHMKKICPAASK